MSHSDEIKYGRNLVLNQLKAELMNQLPSNAQISNVEFEGPFVVLYSKNPSTLMDNGDIVRMLAKKLRKRIVIRYDVKVRMEKEEAKSKIGEIVADSAEITDISFDEELGEATIEAKKPGMVIGRNGTTLREIAKEICWLPRVVRTPPIQSQLIDSIRNIWSAESDRRKEALLYIGQRIHRPTVLQDDTIRLTALGGFSEIGRSCMILETAETKVMIDCGMNVGNRNPNEMYPYFHASEFDINSIDAVLVTHAHLDHSGLIPFLYKWGYRGPVYCNDATLSLMTLLQKDYIEISEKEGKLIPYNQRDIKKTILHTIPRRYKEVTDLSNDIRLTMTPAGHILGSSIMHLHIGDGLYNLAIANDFKYKRTRLLDPANAKFPRLETLIMESTLGGSHDNLPSRKESEQQFIRIINQTIRRGGKILIPTIAVGKAQELIVVLNHYFKNKILLDAPVYLDGLIAEATAIHSCHPEYLSSKLQDAIFNEGRNPFLNNVFQSVKNQSERMEITRSKSPAIILATSGMLSGGSSIEYFKHLASDSRNSIIFTSYQGENTLGRRIASGVKEIRSVEDGRMRMMRVNMDVHQINGFNGHSDRRELMSYVKKLTPKPNSIILIHGQRAKAMSVAQSISKRYKIKTKVPMNLETIRFN